jgi:hypothetical protein
MEEQPAISAYAIAKRLCPEEKNFNSFKIKILRIYKKIIPDNRTDEDLSESNPDSSLIPEKSTFFSDNGYQ